MFSVRSVGPPSNLAEIIATRVPFPVGMASADGGEAGEVGA